MMNYLCRKIEFQNLLVLVVFLLNNYFRLWILFSKVYRMYRGWTVATICQNHCKKSNPQKIKIKTIKIKHCVIFEIGVMNLNMQTKHCIHYIQLVLIKMNRPNCVQCQEHNIFFQAVVPSLLKNTQVLLNKSTTTHIISLLGVNTHHQTQSLEKLCQYIYTIFSPIYIKSFHRAHQKKILQVPCKIFYLFLDEIIVRPS